MKRSTFILAAMTVFVVLIASACGTPAPVEQAAPPPVQSAPTQAPPVQAPPPTEQSVPAQTFAPACQAATTCTAPALTDKPAFETYCVQKVPYQNIMAPAGTIFEPLPKSGDPEFFPLVCADSGTVVGGLNVFSCRGAELWTYDLKVTNPACGGGSLQTGTSQCQAGQGYDAANNCCAPLTGGESGSVIIKVNMGACPAK